MIRFDFDSKALFVCLHDKLSRRIEERERERERSYEDTDKSVNITTLKNKTN